MQTDYDNGSKVLERFSHEQFEKNLADPKVKKITIHAPGSIIQMSDRQYIVMPNGEWRRYKKDGVVAGK